MRSLECLRVFIRLLESAWIDVFGWEVGSAQAYTMSTTKGTTETSQMIRNGKGAITVTQLSEALGLSIHTIYKMIRTGRMPHLRLGSILRFDRAAIADWIDARTFA